MKARKNFDTKYVIDRLTEVASKLGGKTIIYVAGGTAMALENLKEGTKDIDVVVESSEELTAVKTALTGLGYSKPNQDLEIVYRQMQARAILENKDGFRWDVFEKIVAGKLHLSPNMKRRARRHKLSKDESMIQLLSLEDVFLMKGVTDREGDLEDMAKIAEKGINWSTIVEECEWQSKRTGKIWENSICASLEALRTKYKIKSPVERQICRSADKKTLALERQ